MRDTKARILDTAERLFAERGYDGASLRAITAAAKVNLAAVNYHFSSKQALLQAVFARKLSPMNRQRLALLEAFEAESGRDPVPVEKLAYAFIAPVLRLLEQPHGANVSFGKLLGQMYANPSISVRRLFLAEIKEVVRRFQAAFRRSLPGLSSEEVFWRMFFGIGAVIQLLAAGWMIPMVSGNQTDLSDVDGIIDQLTAYMVGGLSAPPAERRRSKEKHPGPPAFVAGTTRGLEASGRSLKAGAR